MSKMTKQEIVNNFRDCEVQGFETFLIDGFSAEIKENGSELDEYNVTLADSDVDENGQLWDTDGRKPWLYIEGETYTVASTDNCFTLGYVYQKANI